MARILYSLSLLSLLSCSRREDQKDPIKAIDSFAVDTAGAIYDTVYYDDEPFSRQVSKLDFFTSLKIQDTIDAYVLSEARKLDSLGIISNDVLKRNLNSIPIRLSEGYTKIPRSSDSNFYQIEFDERDGYW